MTADTPTRHEKMVEAAVWLAEQGFADIGWAALTDGKAPHRKWKSDATDDPALIRKMLHGARNALVIPKGKAAIVDVDDPAAAVMLSDAGMPAGFRVASPTPGHGHFYAWQNGTELPTSFAGGEVRRGGSGMVLGPWALRTDGVYEPNETLVIPELPTAVAEVIARLRVEKRQREDTAGPEDDGWQIIRGRHDFIVRRAVALRRDGLAADLLMSALLRLRDDRCAAPGGRVIEDDEVERIAEWTNGNVADLGDDVGPVLIDTTAPHSIGNRTALDLRYDPSPAQLADPFLTAEGATILYARGGTGKGVTACWLIGQLVAVGHVVMVIDYEGHEREWGIRLRGLGLSEDELARIHYRAPFGADWTTDTGALSKVAGLIREDAERLGVTYLVIDSYSVATSNGDTMGGEAAAREYFGGLATIGRPSLTIAHVRGDSGRFPDRPFGSVFVHNLARETWAVERIGADDPEDPDLMGYGPRVIELELRNRKANGRAMAPAQFVAFSFFVDGTITADTERPRARSVADRIADVLADSPLTPPKIAAAIKDDTGEAIPENTLRKALTRHPQRFVQEEGTRPRKWALR